MQLESLKIFCDVARLHSFSRGAAENGVTQSTASQTVHHLEDHLGVVLIERSRRPLRLTAEGKVFYNGCRQIVHRYADLETAVKSVHGEGNGCVHVAAIYSVDFGAMTEFTQQFHDRHPAAEVEIEYLSPEKVYARVREDTVDFGIVSFPRAERDLDVIPWRDQPMWLACHPRHRLSRRASVSVTDLANERFVAFDENLVIRQNIDRFLRQHDVGVEIELEFDNIEAIKRAVEVDSGVSILPGPTLEHEVSTGTLVAIPFVETGFVRPLGIIHRRGKKFYPTTLAFIELLCRREPAVAPARGNGNGNGNGSRGTH